MGRHTSRVQLPATGSARGYSKDAAATSPPGEDGVGPSPRVQGNRIYWLIFLTWQANKLIFSL